jgi:hypothetical protein
MALLVCAETAISRSVSGRSSPRSRRSAASSPTLCPARPPCEPRQRRDQIGTAVSAGTSDQFGEDWGRRQEFRYGGSTSRPSSTAELRRALISTL